MTDQKKDLDSDAGNDGEPNVNNADGWNEVPQGVTNTGHNSSSLRNSSVSMATKNSTTL